MSFQYLLLFIIVQSINIRIVQSILRGNSTVDDYYKSVVEISNCKEFTDCSGAIIDKYHVLTARHCVIDCKIYEINVHAGKKSRDDGLDLIYIPQKINYYPDNEPIIPIEDIVLLTLSRAIWGGLPEYVKPLDLPKSQPFHCMECIILGWGVTHENASDRTNELLWAPAVILDDETCENLGIKLSENEIATLDLGYKSTTLPADSGGPVICNGILVGIHSSGGRDATKPSVHINVFNFKKWIENIRNNDGTKWRSLNKLHHPQVAFNGAEVVEL